MRTRLLSALALALVLLLPRPATADLLVVSNGTDEVLRYDASTGAFIDAFVPAGSGGVDGATGPTFGPDGNLYVGFLGGDEVLRFDGATGEFLDDFVPADSGGLDVPVFLIFTPESVPEPSSLMLLCAGLLGLRDAERTRRHIRRSREPGHAPGFLFLPICGAYRISASSTSRATVRSTSGGG